MVKSLKRKNSSKASTYKGNKKSYQRKEVEVELKKYNKNKTL